MKFLLLSILVILVAGCQPEERIIPLFKSEKISDADNQGSSSDTFSNGSNSTVTDASDHNDSGQGSSSDGQIFPPSAEDNALTYLTGKYNFEDMGVDQAVGEDSTFANRLLSNIVGLIIKIGGNFEVETTPILIDLDDLDTETIKELYASDIEMCIVNRESTTANFKFLKKIMIQIRDVENPDRKVTPIDYNASDKNSDDYAKRFNHQCIKIEILQANLIKFIKKGTKHIEIIPKIKLGDAPTENFSIKGSVKFKVGVKFEL